MLLHQAVQDECSLTASRRQSGAESALQKAGLAWVKWQGAPLKKLVLQEGAGTPQLSRTSTRV